MNLNLFRDLYVHRDDVFAEQQANGAYFPVRRAVDDLDIEEHLAGFASYGSYVIRPEDQTVKYVVFDLDTEDAVARDVLCATVEATLGKLEFRAPPGESHLQYKSDLLKCLMLEWSGGKGYHVWLFFSEPLPARQVRAWLNKSFMPDWETVAGEKGYPLEVFPKQDEVEPDGFGNLVKWPLGVHAKSGQRSKFLQRQHWALREEDVVPLPSSLVPEAPAAAPSWRPVVATGGGGEANRPKRELAGAPRSTGGTMAGEAPPSPFPCVDRVFAGNVPEGTRNNAVFHLALYYFGHGIPETSALELVRQANDRFKRPLHDREVRTAVHSAYSGRRHGAKCGQDWLRSFCPGPCKANWTVGRPSGGELRAVKAGDTLSLEVVSTDVRAGKRRVVVSHPDATNRPTLVAGA